MKEHMRNFHYNHPEKGMEILKNSVQVGRKPSTEKCPYCGYTSITKVNYQAGLSTYLISLGCIFFG